MMVFYFIFLSVINFFALVGVSMVILYVLRKQDSRDVSSSINQLKQQEEHLQIILDEIAEVTTVLYQDMDKRKDDIKRALSEVNDKLTVLGTLKNSITIVSPQEQHQTPQKTHTRKKNVSARTAERSAAVPAPHPNDAIIKKVYSLTDQGFNVIEIAKMIEKTKGEIELILNLRDVGMKKNVRTTDHETAKK